MALWCGGVETSQSQVGGALWRCGVETNQSQVGVTWGSMRWGFACMRVRFMRFGVKWW